MDKLIECLKEKYDLTQLNLTKLDSHLRLTRLRVEFSMHKSKKKNICLFDCLVKYAAIERMLKHFSSKDLKKIKNKIRLVLKEDMNLLNKITKVLFLNSKRTRDICEHKTRSECFSYSLYKEEGAALHFGNSVCPKNPFKGAQFEKRKKELQKIAIDIKKNHPKVKYVFSVSWITGISPYINLLPSSTEKTREEYTDPEFYSYGHWGQFIRADGTLNSKRVKKFKENWVFPLKTYVSKCSISDFFDMYLPKEYE